MAAIATPILSALLGFGGFFGFIFAFILGPSAGGVLSQIIRTAVSRRRGRYQRFSPSAELCWECFLVPLLGCSFGISSGIFSLPMLALCLPGGVDNLSDFEIANIFAQ
ncbi:MAG: hypothetical protein R2867_35560 [Caldilineaceae bacterium]